MAPHIWIKWLQGGVILMGLKMAPHWTMVELHYPCGTQLVIMAPPIADGNHFKKWCPPHRKLLQSCCVCGYYLGRDSTDKDTGNLVRALCMQQYQTGKTQNVNECLDWSCILSNYSKEELL